MIGTADMTSIAGSAKKAGPILTPSRVIFVRSGFTHIYVFPARHHDIESQKQNLDLFFMSKLACFTLSGYTTGYQMEEFWVDVAVKLPKFTLWL